MILQDKVDAYYDGKERRRIPLSQQKEFKAIKNAVIKEAENIWKCKLFFEDSGIDAESEPEDLDGVTYDYLNTRGDIYNEDFSMEERLEAVKEMEQLANDGDMYAQYLMGKLWRDGPLLTPDNVEARYWFTQAAQQGHIYAQYMLGKMHLMGQGVDYDKRLGNNWLRQSVDQGNVYADALLRRENEHLPPNVFLGINSLLHHMGRIFQNNSIPQSRPGGIQIDRKRMKVLQEKRAALGQKGNVYEEYSGPSMSM